jgi:hypothetical protein
VAGDATPAPPAVQPLPTIGWLGLEWSGSSGPLGTPLTLGWLGTLWPRRSRPEEGMFESRLQVGREDSRPSGSVAKWVRDPLHPYQTDQIA